jgi:hypothetical protein
MGKDDDTVSLTFSGVDNLTTKSRNFYESTRMKMLLSLVYGSFGLLALGLTANSGGRAAGLRVMAHAYDGDDAIYTVQVNGFGFSTFCHFIAFVLCSLAAYLISPYIHGTSREVNLLFKPKEVEHG